MKRLYIILYVLILSSSLAYAVEDTSIFECDDTGLVTTLFLNETSGDLHDSCGLNSYAWTPTNTPVYGKDTNLYSNLGVGANSEDDEFESDDDFGNYTSNRDHTIIIVVNFTGLNTKTEQVLVSNSDGSANGFNFYWSKTTNKLGADYAGAELAESNAIDITNSTNMITWRRYIGNTSSCFFVNATGIGCGLHLDSGESGDPFHLLGLAYAGGYSAIANIFDFALFDRALTDTEIADYYTALLTVAPAEEVTTPTIVAPSPADNANNNTNVTLNVTHSSGLNDVRYYLYFGDETPLGENHLYLNNVTREGDEYKSFTTNISTDGIYYWKWKVQNITGDGLFSANTTIRTWILDTVTPTIELLTNNNWKTDNSTIISSYLYNLSVNISFFDENLYRTLINISNSTGDSVYSNLTTTITETTMNISETIDISTWSIGDYTIKLLATDSHTLNSIGNYDVNEGINYFRYITEEGNVIKISSNNINLFTKRTTQLKDRYEFEFNYLFQQDTYTFTIESYNKIDYLNDSEYNAHFVIIGNNGRGNWVDFNVEGLSDKDYKVTKIDDYIYEVEITANEIKSFTFSSLGGLNTVEEHYKVRLGAVLEVWVFDLENYPSMINATATIGSQSNDTFSNQYPATLVNITKDITSLSLNADGFGTEEKTISVVSNYHNFSFNMTEVSATKLYFYDEKSEALIEGETFSVYLETTGFSQTYSSITDNPETISNLQRGLYKLKASSSNYPERQYLDLNISNVTTTNLNIYLINNTLGSEVTFTVQGSGGNNLDNANIDFFRTINGTSTLIAEETTDFAGQAKLNLDPNYEYNINLVRTGYISRNITLEPSDTEYTIILQSGAEPYESVYAGVRFRFYHNGVMSISPPNILNLTNITQNITFEVEGADVAEIGINFSNHNYACTPASCSTTLAGEGKVKLGILPNESGTFNTAYYFQKTGEKRIYVNDGLIKVIPFIFASLDSLSDWIVDMKEELSPNMRTLLVAMLNVVAVGVGASLGLAGATLVIPVLAVTVICSLPEIGLIHPFIGMIIAIFGVVVYVYAQSR